MAPWAHLSPHPKRHLDCFSCFSTAHGYVQDTQTHTHRPSSIGNNTPHLCTLCIWLDLVITITQGEPNDATNVEKDLENTNSSEATATRGIYRSNESTTTIRVTASSLSSTVTTVVNRILPTWLMYSRKMTEPSIASRNLSKTRSQQQVRLENASARACRQVYYAHTDGQTTPKHNASGLSDVGRHKNVP